MFRLGLDSNLEETPSLNQYIALYTQLRYIYCRLHNKLQIETPDISYQSLQLSLFPPHEQIARQSLMLGFQGYYQGEFRVIRAITSRRRDVRSGQREKLDA